jgi:hypothetical protein
MSEKLDRNQVQAGARARLVAAGVGVSLLAAIVIAVVVFSSGEGEGVEGAPADCVESWNTGEGAATAGSHAASLHGATSAWVVYLSERGEKASAADGMCAVIFPSPQPDPEPEFGVTVETSEGWLPLFASRRAPVSREYFGGRSPVSLDRIGELQREAMSATNATLLPDGTLSQP